MSLNAASLKMLAEKGFTPLEMAEFAALLEAGQPRSKSAERQARYRERKRNGVTCDVTSDVTGDVTTPPNESISNPPSSEPNGSGSAAADPLKELFDVGVSILVGAGQTEKQARSLIGKWRKPKDRPDGEVLQALIDCRTRAISNPVEWLEKRFQGGTYVSASGYQYRGSLEQIQKEAQRRHDNDTYWQIEVDKKRGALAHG